ncbi:ankyrin repeat domain-containing protein [Gemmata massiliana]|uniref:ankyrin repeat domain-containing protein n=1 Tax=Gemmata massiliana TaxID=1210884 RepID=UPI0013A6EAA4|nr:ankyrin repeat domain-containing protein [Gemmata massiliana]
MVDAAQLMEEIKEQPMISQAIWGGGQTLLHVAAGEGHRELVELLLRLGADVNAYCPEGTPLHYAVGGGSAEVLKLLVEAGSDLNRQECRGRTPVDLARNPAHNHAFVKYLISVGAVPNESSTAETVQYMKNDGMWDAIPDNLFLGPFSPNWRTDTVLALVRHMRESQNFSAMPILGDALQDAGCDNTDVLNHCRDASAPHVRGYWVVDLVLGKE